MTEGKHQPSWFEKFSTLTSEVIIHIPHASCLIPKEVRNQIVLSDSDPEVELIRMTDRFTDELFSIPGLPAVVFPVSRLVVDPERFVDDRPIRAGVGPR